LKEMAIDRRKFIASLIAWPSAAAAQQAFPVIGYLSTLSERQAAHMLAAFRAGLKEGGFVEGQNVRLDLQWADGKFDRLPGLAREMVARKPRLMFAQAPPAALALKAATTDIPIVFAVGFDPVSSGLVASLNRPGGNVTGMAMLNPALGPKRLEILKELIPRATKVGMLLNPSSPDAAPEMTPIRDAAPRVGIEFLLVEARTEGEIDAALHRLASLRVDAVLVGADPFYMDRRKEIAEEAARLGLPAVYPFREFVTAGGLLSYGTSISETIGRAGQYAARILKGAQPSELPVQQPTTFQLVINSPAAKALRLTIPPTLLARADEVIE
jgi:putative ABC transport system substrate-binding protein